MRILTTAALMMLCNFVTAQDSAIDYNYHTHKVDKFTDEESWETETILFENDGKKLAILSKITPKTGFQKDKNLKMVFSPIEMGCIDDNSIAIFLTKKDETVELLSAYKYNCSAMYGIDNYWYPNRKKKTLLLKGEEIVSIRIPTMNGNFDYDLTPNQTTELKEIMDEAFLIMGW